jgi:steroid delta-isomerase-like uncharacterized protein
MSQENKALVRRVIEEIYTSKNVDLADEIYRPDFVDNDAAAPEEMRRGPEGVKAQAAMYKAAFPDISMTVEDQVAEGDKVVTRWTATGTHEGELMGAPASGKPVSITGITISRIADGKVQQEWTNWDGLGMMEQIGALGAE